MPSPGQPHRAVADVAGEGGFGTVGSGEWTAEMGRKEVVVAGKDLSGGERD
ncbi:hypothetical protein HanPI659440_Chr04g0156211 [Helianthus annuus]|nr:hypothetical protein HanPI659440_Chr04g0156211 [Helianthus annuus]